MERTSADSRASVHGPRVIPGVRRFLFLHAGAAATVRTLLVNFLILGLNVGTGIITARALGPGGRGEQAAMVLWPQFLAYTVTLGLPLSLLYNLKQHPEERSQLFSVALILGTVMGSFASLVGVLIIPLWLDKYSPEVVRFAQWLMPLAPLLLLTLMFLHVLQAREEFSLFNVVRYLQPLLTLLALLLLAVFGRLTPFNATLSYVLPVIPVSLWMLIRLWSIYRPVWRDLRPAFGRLTSYGLRSYVMDVLGPATSQIDRVLVVGLLDPALAGLYVVALSLSKVLNAFQTAVASIFFPRASGRSVEDVVELSGRAARVSTVATALSAAGIALLGPLLLGLVYGRGFLDAVPVFRILLFEVTLGCTAWVLAQAYVVLNRPGVVSAMQGAGVGLSVMLMLVLVPRYELEGVGMALLIATAARLVFIIASFPLVLGVRPPSLRPRLEDFTKMLRRTDAAEEGER